MTRENIFIPLYRSFAFRYLLSTRIFEELSKNYKIICFIDMKYKQSFEYYLKKYDVIFEDINNGNVEKKFSIVKDFFIILKKFFNGERKNFKNNSHVLWNIMFMEELKKKHLFFFVKIIAFFLKKSLILRRAYNIVDAIVDNQKYLIKYYKKYTPKLLIITSYGYDLDQYFVRAAKKEGCKTISIIYSWDNPTSKGYKSSDSDYYLVWNENMKKELIIFHDIKEEKIKICGTAHWDTFYNDLQNKDEIKSNFFKKWELNPDQKIILFFSSSPRDFKNAYEKIDKICLLLKDNPNYLLIARMHPLYMDQNICQKFLGKTNEYYEKELLYKYSKKLIFINPKVIPFGSKSNEVFYPLEDLEVLKQLYCSADLLLNEYSTTLLEGYIFDLPIINVAIGKYRNTDLPISFYGELHHLWRLKKYKAIIECDNYESLKKTIVDILNGKDETKENRKKLLDSEMNINRGNASNKIIDKIVDIAKN
jgi:hypothetical protein